MPMMKEMLTNKILSGLPPTEFGRLLTLLEPVSLSAGETLCGPGEPARFVYFPEGAVLSYQAATQDGKIAEVGMVGREGLAGLPALPGRRASAHSLNVTAAGSALRVSTREFGRELRGAEALRQSLLAYASEYIEQVSQRAACSILHRLEQRFVVWLLMLTDRLGTDTVEITQERIAQHLGVRRAGVTVIAGQLQEQGAISYTRGTLRAVDRQALKTVACECYGALSGAHPQAATI